MSTGRVLLIASLLGCACTAPTRPAPSGHDEPDEPEPDAAVVVRDAAADRARANLPEDASVPPPDTAPATPADGPAPDLAHETSADGPGADGPPVTAGAYLIEGLSGDVTARELDTFIATTAAASIPVAMWTQSNVDSHNILCTFGRGCACRDVPTNAS